MKVAATYSFKDGENYIKTHFSTELKEVYENIAALDAAICLTKESKEKTKTGKLLFSPVDMNNYLKLLFHEKGWTEKSQQGKKKRFVEPRHSFGKGRFREMDGLKNNVGLEIQFGKYAFMGYDIFSKMVIFNKLGYIKCGIEIVPSTALTRQMSTGVSSFDQLLVDFKYRGESNIDIPVLVISLDLTEEERKKSEAIQNLFKNNRSEALKTIKLRPFNGSKPGPK